MVVNSTEICNYALEFIGARTIENLTDATRKREAELCNRYYDMSRRAVLRDHLWSFATKTSTLGLIAGDAPVGWDYAYQYPVDALYAYKLYSASITEKIAYEIRSNDTLTSKYLLTDQEEATLIYVADADEENLFDSLFVEALAYRIAGTIVIPLKGDSVLQQSMTQNYLGAVTKAKASDSNESYKTPLETNLLLDSRA